MGEETALLAFVVPILDIPIDIPVTVRTGVRLRPDASPFTDITQLTPLAGAELTIWGVPGRCRATTSNASRKGAPGEPVQLPRARRHILRRQSGARRASRRTRSPTTRRICTGEPPDDGLEVQTYQDPGHISRGGSAATRQPTDCDTEVFNPVLYSSPTTGKPTLPRAQHRPERAPVPRLRRISLGDRGKRSSPCRAGLTINPDAADGQTMCTEAQANFGSEGPATAPTSRRSGPSRSAPKP